MDIEFEKQQKIWWVQERTRKIEKRIYHLNNYMKQVSVVKEEYIEEIKSMDIERKILEEYLNLIGYKRGQ